MYAESRPNIFSSKVRKGASDSGFCLESWWGQLLNLEFLWAWMRHMVWGRHVFLMVSAVCSSICTHHNDAIISSCHMDSNLFLMHFHHSHVQNISSQEQQRAPCIKRKSFHDGIWQRPYELLTTFDYRRSSSGVISVTTRRDEVMLTNYLSVTCESDRVQWLQ